MADGRLASDIIAAARLVLVAAQAAIALSDPRMTHRVDRDEPTFHRR